ncbi:hypothetical protein A2997_00520 [Candidatus Nomurabacteria bacterium RIFCSPLOWO2_01_FULL_36_10b]|uniref:Uncharacterized protein n=1 Tax=Candidatus Nomurabacteria bacterium RIFCSPLOWO2_01_FULL_36_10b TaxID=1801766 RepID=A0A1F6WQ69_9BACT|nr:MAG: hypothetical protein A2997_00520 [Candidatus Nomurabacteria bacterium RIFCSPLOWO2_01_FULL_36_10b]
MFLKKKKIEDIIIDILSSGPENTLILIEKIRGIRHTTTKQAVYKVLRGLRDNEVIVQRREEVMISNVWLGKISDFIETTQMHYLSSAQLSHQRPDSNFLSLKEKEKISYTFKTFETTDIFWAHAFNILTTVSSSLFPVGLYNPHEWFILTRPESELFIFDNMKKENKSIMILAGGTTPLDIFVKKYFDATHKRYFACPDKLFPKRNYYVNVFDDFIIEVWLDHKISERIDNFYNTTTTFNDIEREKLLDITRAKGRNKLVISRNKAKADKLRKVFKKYFVF